MVEPRTPERTRTFLPVVERGAVRRRNSGNSLTPSAFTERSPAAVSYGCPWGGTRAIDTPSSISSMMPGESPTTWPHAMTARSRSAERVDGAEPARTKGVGEARIVAQHSLLPAVGAQRGAQPTCRGRSSVLIALAEQELLQVEGHGDLSPRLGHAPAVPGEAYSALPDHPCVPGLVLAGPFPHTRSPRAGRWSSHGGRECTRLSHGLSIRKPIYMCASDTWVDPVGPVAVRRYCPSAVHLRHHLTPSDRR